MLVSMDFAGVGPVGGVDYPRRYQEFRAWFPDDVACAAYLARLRWPEGFRCPLCGGDRAWQTSTAHWKCTGCGRKTSVTAGTIFHRTRTPLTTWFAAIWLVTSQKNGASAQNLHDMLGLGSYETAWAWLHKLRRAMVRPDRELLSGVVEVDESFVWRTLHGTRRSLHRKSACDDRSGKPWHTSESKTQAGSGATWCC
jgi:transposase-like protein